MLVMLVLEKERQMEGSDLLANMKSMRPQNMDVMRLFSWYLSNSFRTLAT